MNSQEIMKFDIDFSRYIDIFLEQNSVLNLISKNEEKFLYEKHIYDSLAFNIFADKYNKKTGTLLDIGTGGGFPAVPISMAYPKIQVTALDSIRKKINAIINIKNELNITNLEPLCERAENLVGQKFDIITSRAVATISVLVKYVAPLLERDGYFIAYKSKRADCELEEARTILTKYNLKLIDSLEYLLPLDDVYERKLLIFQKQK